MVSWEPRPLHVAVPYPSLPSSLSFPGHAWLAGSHAEQLETAGGGVVLWPLFLVFLDGPERPCQPSDPGTVNQQGSLHPGQRSSDAQPVGPSLP